MRLRTETRALADLTPYPRNNKRHPQPQVDAIKASIQRFGFNDPIGVTESGMIVEGHGRHLAALQLGLTDVPVIVLPADVTEDMIDLYRIAHNKIALNSTFDFMKLKEELADIVASSTVRLGDMGFDQFQAARMGFGQSDAAAMSGSGAGQDAPAAADTAGLDFSIVWASKEERQRFQAFGEKVKATYGGTLGSALTDLLRDIRTGHVTRAGGITYNPAATADDAERLQW